MFIWNNEGRRKKHIGTLHNVSERRNGKRDFGTDWNKQ